MTDKPDGKAGARVTAATAIFTVIVLGINLLLGLVQGADHFRRGAIHIVIVENPIANMVLLAIGVALAPLLRRQAQGVREALRLCGHSPSADHDSLPGRRALQPL